MMDRAAVFGLLRRSVADAGGQRVWAAAHKVSPSYLNDVMTARRDPGGKILAALGLRRVVRFERVAA